MVLGCLFADIHDILLLLNMFGRCACISISFLQLCFAWEDSREALGDAWGIIEGQLGDLRSISDKLRERMMTCDVIR